MWKHIISEISSVRERAAIVAPFPQSAEITCIDRMFSMSQALFQAFTSTHTIHYPHL